MKQQGRTPARLPYISSLPHTHELQSSCPSKKPFYMRGFICAHASRVGTRPRQSQSGLRKGPVYSCRTGQETPRTWDLGGGPGVSVAGGPGVSVARGSSGPGVYLKARAPEAEPKSTLRVAEAHWRVTVTESAGKEVCSVLELGSYQSVPPGFRHGHRISTYHDARPACRGGRRVVPRVRLRVFAVRLTLEGVVFYV